MAKGRNQFHSKANNSYSEEEILTGGNWIDGKPIYRKVIGADIVSGSANIDLTSLNIEFICPSTEAIFYDEDYFVISKKGTFTNKVLGQEATISTVLEWSITLEDNTLGVSTFVIESNLQTSTVTVSLDVTYVKFQIALEYTKTTD